ILYLTPFFPSPSLSLSFIVCNAQISTFFLLVSCSSSLSLPRSLFLSVPPSSLSLSPSLPNSLTHSHTHPLTQSLPHSLTHSPTHSVTPSLPPSLSPSPDNADGIFLVPYSARKIT